MIKNLPVKDGWAPLSSALGVINVDKNAAYSKAEASLKAAGILPEAVELRQVKYLNNLIEQTIGSSNAWSSPGWVSFRSRRRDERSKAMK